jgi:hypothetical protein
MASVSSYWFDVRSHLANSIFGHQISTSTVKHSLFVQQTVDDCSIIPPAYATDDKVAYVIYGCKAIEDAFTDLYIIINASGWRLLRKDQSQAYEFHIKWIDDSIKVDWQSLDDSVHMVYDI